MEEPQLTSARGRWIRAGPDTSWGTAGAGSAPPTRLFVEDVSQEEDDDAEGDEGCPPGQQEHDDH